MVRLIIEHPVVRQVTSNSGWLLAERFVNLALRFGVSIWVIRYLGPDAYGTLWYAVSVASLATAFAGLGLGAIVIRKLSLPDGNERRILRTALTLRLLSGAVATAAVSGLAFVIADDAITRIAIILASAQLLFQASNVWDMWFEAKILSKYAAWARTAVNLVFVGSQVALILVDASVLAFVAVFSMQVGLQSIATGLMYRWVRKDAPSSEPAPVLDLALARSMLKDAWPLIFAGLSTAIYFRIDQVMIGMWLDAEAVGVYATAVKLSEVWYVVPSIIAASVYPKIITAVAQLPPDEYAVRMQALFDGLALVAYAVIVPIVVGAGWLVDVLFGAEYAASAGILQIHVWAFLFHSLGVARSRWLEAENYTRFAMIAAIAGAVSNIGLNVLLIPGLGIAGAAWATVGSQVISSYASGYFASDVRPTFVQMTRALVAPLRLHTFVRQTRQILSSK